MYVRNEVTHDARVLREAATLADTGREVTIVGRLPDHDGVPAREIAGGVTIVRVREATAWRGAWREALAEIRAPWRARHRILRGLLGRDRRRGARGRAARDLALLIVAWPWILYRVLDRIAGGRLPAPAVDGALDGYVRWNQDAHRWAAAAVAAAPGADVHHGHDLTGLLAAREAAARDGVPFVYDSHDLAADATSMAGRPAWVRALVRRLERVSASGAAAVVTVNDGLADVLRTRLVPSRLVVVHNCPARPTGEGIRDGRLRQAAGLDLHARVILYHGGLMLHRGIEELLDALALPDLADVHAVFLGYGPLHGRLADEAATGLMARRIHLLKPVPPAELPAWVADADVGVMAIQPTTLNHRLSTPNKLFDCISAGTPVVASDLPGMRPIVEGGPDGPLGLLCDPTDPVSIAVAVRTLLDSSPSELETLRARIRRAADERWNWETEGGRLVTLYDDLAMETSR